MEVKIQSLLMGGNGKVRHNRVQEVGFFDQRSEVAQDHGLFYRVEGPGGKVVVKREEESFKR